MTTIATPPHVDKESNPWESQRARFDLAAQKLNLDEGLWRVLRYPNREITVHIPVQMDDGRIGALHRIPRTAFHRPRASQGRNPVRPGGERWMKFALSPAWMTWKCAVVDIPIRRRKGWRLSAIPTKHVDAVSSNA
jgi:glutamate dehydrogenase (NAD(P)+)